MSNIKDKRLPKGVSIWLNNFKEFVAIENESVAQYKNKGISASRTLEGAILNYLNKDTSHIL